MKELENRLLAVLSAGTFEHIRFGMEATQNYGFHLAESLSSSDRLSAWKPLVYVINAKYIKDFKLIEGAMLRIPPSTLALLPLK